MITCQKLLELRWDVLPHPLYNLGIAPSVYFFFRSLQTSLNNKKFNNDDDIVPNLALIKTKFYERGILMLTERWLKVIDQNGQYGREVI